MSLIIATLTCVFLVSGCESPSVKWVGYYEGEQTDLVDPKLNDPIANSLRIVKLELKADMSYTLVKASIPQSGEAGFAADHVSLHPTKILDQPMERQSEETKKQNPDLTVTRKADGRIYLSDPGSFGVKEIEMKRVTKKD